MKLNQKEILKNYIKKKQKVVWVGALYTNYLVKDYDLDIEDFYFIEPIPITGPGKIYNYAITDEDGVVDIYISDIPSRNSIFKNHAVDKNGKPSSFGYTVPSLTMNSFFEKFKIDNIDWVIINAEGAEYVIFNGPTNWIDKTKNMIVLFHTDKPGGMPENRDEIREEVELLLEVKGFKLEKQEVPKKFIRVIARKNL